MLGRGVRPRVWRRCHAPVTGLLGRIRARLRRQPRTAQKPRWLYKVVQMVPHQPPDPEQASRKLSGALSAEGLRKQFPEIYSPSAQGNPQESLRHPEPQEAEAYSHQNKPLLILQLLQRLRRP